MLNNLIITFFVASVDDPMWMWIAKGLNCWFWIFAGISFIGFIIRVWDRCRQIKEEQDEEKTMNPIGFR